MAFLTAHRRRRSACRVCACSGTFWSLAGPRCWPDVGSAHRSLPGTKRVCCSLHTHCSAHIPRGSDGNSAEPGAQDEGYFLTNRNMLFILCVFVLHLPCSRSEVDGAPPTGQSALHPQQVRLLIPGFLTGT